ncbi:MAG: hypothetical protein P8M34_03215 [Saprospiraceae bacterium]|nr:hypothetical protein [Saprospiraceae bacterium]
MFRFEKEMIPIIRDGLINKYNFNYICEEFPSGLGYVDIAASKRLNERTVHANDIELVYIISNYLNRKNKKISPKSITQKYNLNKKLISKVISYLEINDFVHANKEGELFVSQRIEPAVNELYTIEAKLTNWKSAIFQARRNLSIASKSYVAFPSSKITKSKIELCKENSIGLISVKKDSIEIILKAKSSNNLDKTNFFFSAETFSSKIQDSTGSNNRYDRISTRSS